IDAATNRFRLTSDERQLLLGAGKGEGLLLLRGNRIPIHVVASPSEYRLATTSPRDLEQLALEARTAASAPPRSRRRPSVPGDLGAVFSTRRDRTGVAVERNGASHDANG